VPRILAVLVVVVSVGSVLAHGQGYPAPLGHDLLTCSPAPCVLPATQVSQQGAVNAVIAADPANAKDLLLGTYDSGCSYSM